MEWGCNVPIGRLILSSSISLRDLRPQVGSCDVLRLACMVGSSSERFEGDLEHLVDK